jgi:hypothetical protein
LHASDGTGVQSSQGKGVTLSRWSLAEIVKRLLVLQIAGSISTSTVWRWFRADKLKPWQFHNWQHILDPQKFLERTSPVPALIEMSVATVLSGRFNLPLA